MTRTKARKNMSLSLMMARKASSSRKGAHKAMAKGQPKMPATANQKMPQDVFRPPRQSIKAAAPSMAAYMAKLEGRYEALAWKFPGDTARAIM
jgi:hypothetical protein